MVELSPHWRTPQQLRSHKRFHQILDAAANLFVESGFESVTTDQIAARANTSVGGLYRFFRDKSGVFYALLDRYLQQLRQLAQALNSETALSLCLDIYVSQLVDAFDQFAMANPPFRVVFAQARLMPVAAAMMVDFYGELAQLLNFYLARHNPQLDSRQRDLLCTVTVEVTLALDMLALSRDQEFQHQVLAETKRLIIAYLAEFLTN